MTFLAAFDVSDLLSRFPALWVVIGAGFAGIIAYLIARKAMALSASAQDKLIKILQESVGALEKERNDYRQSAHDCRANWQSCELKLKEAEARPDLTRLFEAQQNEAARRYEVYTQQTTLIGQQSEVLAGVSKMLDKLVRDTEEHERQNVERHMALCDLLKRTAFIDKRRRKPKTREA